MAKRSMVERSPSTLRGPVKIVRLAPAVATVATVATVVIVANTAAESRLDFCSARTLPALLEESRRLASCCPGNGFQPASLIQFALEECVI